MINAKVFPCKINYGKYTQEHMPAQVRCARGPPNWKRPKIWILHIRLLSSRVLPSSINKQNMINMIAKDFLFCVCVCDNEMKLKKMKKQDLIWFPTKTRNAFNKTITKKNKKKTKKNDKHDRKRFPLLCVCMWQWNEILKKWKNKILFDSYENAKRVQQNT